ncbi:MAG: hypothetical protein IJN49_08760 [Clostridia bacterium]|nr:hypothetical protein [Clostridia bacterium]
MINNKNNIPDGFHNAVLDAFQEIEVMSNSTKQTNKSRVLKVVAVVAVSGILLSISAFAYTEISNWLEKTGRYSATVNNSELEYNEAPEYAKVELGYLGDGFTELEPPYKYNYNGEAGLSFNIFRMGSERKNEYKNVISTEKTSFGENEAEILTLNENKMSLALIYFEEKGVVVECYFNNHIPKDELNKILSDLKVVEATEDDALTYDYESVPHSEYFVDDTPQTEKIVKFGESCENGWDFETNAYYNIKVVKAEVLDNVNGIDKSDLHSAEKFNSIVNKDGTLKGYNREEIIYGDGINSIDTIKDVKFVDRKLVAVTIEATNINNTAGSLFCSTYSLVAGNTHITHEAFALCSENDTDSRFYFVSVDANGTQTVTIYYLVDGDVDFNNLYLQTNNLYTQSKRNTHSLLELKF